MSPTPNYELCKMKLKINTHPSTDEQQQMKREYCTYINTWHFN